MNQTYYSGSKLFWLNVALGLGTFIQILDTSIANVAVPYIAGNLSVSADEGTWVITSFAASNAFVLPLTGWLSSYFGRVRLFVVSVLLFALMSFFCGFSSSLTMLVFFRVLQGAVAGSLIPLSQSLLIGNSPPEKQGTALGFWSMIVVVAPVLGPILGGYLCDNYTWRWIFYINVPIGLFSALVVWFLLQNRESLIEKKPIDWFGLFLLGVGVGCLQIMLDKGKDLDWFRSNVIIALTIISIIALTLFVVWNYFEEYPIIDFSFFSNRNYVLGTFIITVGFLFYFGSTVIVPLWLQTQELYTAYWAGVAVAPIGIFPIFLSPIVGKYLNRVDLRFLTSLSFVIFGLTFIYQAQFITGIDLRTIMWVRLLQGIAIPIFFIPLVQLSLGEIPGEKYASASGVFHFFRILFGSGFGTSLAIELWTLRETLYENRLGESITNYRTEITSLYNYLADLNPFFNHEVTIRLVDMSVVQQAYVLATNDLSWLAGWALLCLAPLPFFCKRVQVTAAAAAPAH